MAWARKQTQQFLEAIKCHPNLYLIKSPQYKNRHARNDAWSKILAEMHLIKPDVTVTDLKTKFNALRTNFMAEYKKAKTSKRSGVGTDAIYKPTLWYYDMISFILDDCEQRISLDSIVASSSSNTEDGSEAVDTIYSQDEEMDESYIIDDEGYLVREEPPMQEAIAETPKGCNTPNTETATLKRKRCGKGDSSDKIMKEASVALTAISSAISKKNDSSLPCEADRDKESLAKFIVSKLKSITDDSIRLQIEEEVIQKLYEGIRRCKELH